jgi:serine protease Do
MRVTSNQTQTQSWVALLLVGAFIIIAVILLPRIVSASSSAGGEQSAAQVRDDGWFRVLTGRGGSRIGVSVAEVETSDTAAGFDEGALVESVRQDSPAADAGLQAGDVVVEFDGERVRSARQLSRLVQETPAGREVTALVVRDNERVRLNVIPEDTPGLITALEERLPELNRLRRDYQLAIPAPGAGERFGRDFNWDFRLRRGDRPRRLGIQVSEVGSQLGEYLGVDRGVLVMSVTADSVADAAGLRAGDVVTALDGRPVDDVDTLRRRVADVEGTETFTIEITRDRDEMTLQSQFEEEEMDDPTPTRRRRRVGV